MIFVVPVDKASAAGGGEAYGRRVLGRSNGHPEKGSVVPARSSAPSPHQRRRVTVRLLPSGPDPVPVMDNR